MSDPIMSPDGNFMWTGSEWIPAPPAQKSPLETGRENDLISFAKGVSNPIVSDAPLMNLAKNPPSLNPIPQIHDSVIMGDFQTNTQYNTFQAPQTNIHNHMNAMIDALSLDDIPRSNYIFDTAKKENYQLAMGLYNGEYHDKIVNAKFRGIRKYCKEKLDGNELNVFNHTLENIEFWKPLLEEANKKIDEILMMNRNHIPTLMLAGKVATKWSGLGGGIKRAEKMYKRVLQIDPRNEKAKMRLQKARKKSNTTIVMAIGIWIVVVFLFVLLFNM